MINKFIFNCSLLVLPVILLYVIFEEGSKLKAPHALKGTWLISDQVVPKAREFCNPILLPLDNPHLNIIQSGRQITLQMNDVNQTLFDGLINDDRIRVSTYLHSKKKAAASECRQPLRIGLRAKISNLENEDIMLGEIRVRNCEICNPVEFIATRPRTN